MKELLGCLKNNMRILITGGLGYIGGRLAELLTSKGHYVILATRKLQKVSSWFKKANVVTLDWESDTCLDSICKNIDVVVQAAGMNAKDCEDNPQLANYFNGQCSLRLFEAAQKNDVEKFFYLSTAHVYERPLVGNFDENSPTNNTHPYAYSNLLGERMILDAKMPTSTTPYIFRISNSFGRPVDQNIGCWDLVINAFSKQAVESGSISLKSKRDVKRDFISMSEVCRTLAYFLEVNKVTVPNNTFNLVSGKSLYLSDVVDLVKKCCEKTLGFSPEVNFHFSEIKGKNLSLRSKNLDRIGLWIKSDYTDEVINLIKFCNDIYGKPR